MIFHKVAVLFTLDVGLGTLSATLPEGAMAKRSCKTGLDNRCRDDDGEIRHKRSDTLVRTLRGTYGADFAKGYRSDAKLGTVLDGENANSLSDLLKR